jgi:hypothetical protein
MKRVGLIVVAVLVAAIAAPVLLIATLPTAKVTIHAIRPTGKFAAYTNVSSIVTPRKTIVFSTVVSGPVWLFGITNVGRATADWNCSRRDRPYDTF